MVKEYKQKGGMQGVVAASRLGARALGASRALGARAPVASAAFRVAAVAPAAASRDSRSPVVFPVAAGVGATASMAPVVFPAAAGVGAPGVGNSSMDGSAHPDGSVPHVGYVNNQQVIKGVVPKNFYDMVKEERTRFFKEIKQNLTQEKLRQHGSNTLTGLQGTFERNYKLLVFELFTGFCIYRPPPILRFILNKGIGEVEARIKGVQDPQLKELLEFFNQPIAQLQKFDYIIKSLGIIKWNNKNRSIKDFLLGVGMYTKRDEQQTYNFSVLETIIPILVLSFLFWIRKKLLEPAVDKTFQELKQKMALILSLENLISIEKMIEAYKESESSTGSTVLSEPVYESQQLVKALKELLNDKTIREEFIDFINEQLEHDKKLDDDTRTRLENLLTLLAQEQVGAGIVKKRKSSKTKKKKKQNGGSTRLLRGITRSISRHPKLRPNLAPIRVSTTSVKPHDSFLKYSTSNMSASGPLHSVGKPLHSVSGPLHSVGKPVKDITFKKSEVLTHGFKNQKHSKFIDSVFENSTAFDNYFKKTGVLVHEGKPRTATDFTIRSKKHSRGENFKFSYFETIVKGVIFIMVMIIRYKLMEGLRENSYDDLIKKIKTILDKQPQNSVDIDKLLKDKDFSKNFRLLLKDEKFRDDFIKFLNRFQNLEEIDKLNPEQKKILKKLLVLVAEEYDVSVGIGRVKTRSKNKKGKSSASKKKRKHKNIGNKN